MQSAARAVIMTFSPTTLSFARRCNNLPDRYPPIISSSSSSPIDHPVDIGCPCDGGGTGVWSPVSWKLGCCGCRGSRILYHNRQEDRASNLRRSLYPTACKELLRWGSCRL